MFCSLLCHIIDYNGTLKTLCNAVKLVENYIQGMVMIGSNRHPTASNCRDNAKETHVMHLPADLVLNNV